MSYGLDCTWIQSLPDLEYCVEPAISHYGTRDQKAVFIPVAWDEIEIQPGQQDWALMDLLVPYLKDLDLTPVLVLNGTPHWLSQRTDSWDRDNPQLPSSFPREFAAFAAKAAQRYQEKVHYMQLDVVANVALDDFPYAVSPVRYGQMVSLAARQIRRNAPDMVLLSAPILPVERATLATVPPELWLSRFSESQGQGHLDVWQWRPQIVSDNAIAQERSGTFTLLTHSSFPVSHPMDRQSLHWWFTYPANRVLTNPYKSAESSGTEIVRSFSLDRWLTVIRAHDLPVSESERMSITRASPVPFTWLYWMSLVFCLLVVIAVWRQAVAAFLWLKQFIGRYEHAISPSRLDFLICAIALGTLWAAFASSWWHVTCLCLIVLLGLTYLRPYLIWLMLLVALPFDYINANSLTPLQLHSFSLSPAQILALVQMPVWCSSVVRQLSIQPFPHSRAAAWTISSGGLAWLLLSVLSHEQRPEATRLSQVLELEVFPLYVAALSWWWLSRTRVFWVPLTALSSGVALFAVISLLIWIVSPWTPGPPEFRLRGLTFSPNHAAMILLRGFWLALGLAVLRFHAGHLRALHLALATITGWALLLTFSRGALILGMPASLLVWVWWQNHTPGQSRFNLSHTVLGVIAVVTAVLLGMALLRFSLWDRLLDVTPIAARWSIWQHTWQLWLEHPWLGQGSDGFYWGAAANFPYSPLLNPEILHPHNVGLEILVRSGLAGLAGMVLFCGLLFRSLYIVSRDPKVRWIVGPAGIALAGGLAHGLVDTFWSLPDIAAMNLILFVIILHWGQRKRPGAYVPGPIQPLPGEA